MALYVSIVVVWSLPLGGHLLRGKNRGGIRSPGIELFRRDTELYYFKNSNECDFIVKQGPRPMHAIQVCWELTKHNEKRELNGIARALKSLDQADLD